MSYDTSILIPDGEPIDVGNYTSNAGRWFSVVLPGPYPGGGRYDGVGPPEPRRGLQGLSGLLCADALPHLRAAVAILRTEPPELVALEPSNGWGSVATSADYLDRIAEACAANPGGTLAVNW